MKKINFKNKFAKFDKLWEPKVIAKLNDYEFKLVKIKNDFIWHHHEETEVIHRCLLQMLQRMLLLYLPA